VSAFTRRRAEQVGGWRFRRAVVTPPGVDRALFPPLDQPPERPWRWRLLWLGRVVGPKGVETAIRALGLLPQEALLEIVGPVTPTFRAELEDLAASTGVAERLRFAHAPHAEVRTYYQASDVTLFTSAIAHEAFGLVPLEAMASACPVVCTGVGGSGEYCHDGVNCLRVPPRDPAALATAVQRLAAESALRGRIVEGGLRTAAALTVERQARAIERCLYAEIASR
jgi:glycosyltransferase involved in cell wall biosynthesis